VEPSDSSNIRIAGDVAVQMAFACDDVSAAIREVRDRYEAGTATAEDDEFLRNLVAEHPEAEAKIGCEIDRFETRRNLNNIGFWIIRTDGKSTTDFSFGKCLSGC
jgi:hypothetical protein